ncbi:MAG TPA: biotin/lipoyl-containing protein, partial [Pantanalinema sp.]
TVEFMVGADKNFYFLEMNTRIQVEHTVTEMVYGVDLVKEQIRIAAGEAIADWLLGDLQPRGWSLECRVNAEDPSQNFRPSPGLITRYRRPGGLGVRIDDAVYSGYRIPDQYDSMIAKVVTWGKDRPEAIARMKRALKEMIVEGVPTTIPLHLSILDHPSFVSGDLTTHFIGQEMTKEDLAKLAPPALDPLATVVAGDEPRERGTERQFEVVVNRELFAVTVSEIGAQATLTAVKPKRPGAGRSAVLAAASGSLTAPMHATVSRVPVELGQVVTAGTPLVVLEAMKMETEITAPVDGTVVELNVKPGQTVEGGQVLAVVK